MELPAIKILLIILIGFITEPIIESLICKKNKKGVPVRVFENKGEDDD